MKPYETAKRIYELYVESGKKYVCLNGDNYSFSDDYDNKYELCTSSFNVIQAYLKVYDTKAQFVQPLLARLGHSTASMITLKPPFSLYNNAVYVFLGQQLFYHDELEIVKTKTGYNDESEPVLKVYIKYNMNPMSLEAIAWCVKLAFTYNKPIRCGVYGVLFG